MLRPTHQTRHMGFIAETLGRCRRRVREGDDAGFTVIELMVAVGVLLAAMVAMLSTISSAFVGVAMSRQRQAAANLADQAIEQARALPFNTLKNGLDNTD